MFEQLRAAMIALSQAVVRAFLVPWRALVTWKLHPVTKNAGSQVHTVKFRGEEIKVQKGELLRTALMRRKLTPHNGKTKVYNCRGLAVCGTCAVEVKENSHVKPERWNIHEIFRLGMLPPFITRKKNLRLACQCEVDGDLEVIKHDGIWGQGYGVSTESPDEFKAPLGEHEFILDIAQSGYNRPIPEELAGHKPIGIGSTDKGDAAKLGTDASSTATEAAPSSSSSSGRAKAD